VRAGSREGRCQGAWTAAAAAAERLLRTCNSCCPAGDGRGPGAPGSCGNGGTAPCAAILGAAAAMPKGVHVFATAIAGARVRNGWGSFAMSATEKCGAMTVSS